LGLIWALGSALRLTHIFHLTLFLFGPPDSFWDWVVWDERPRFTYHFYLNYNLLWTPDLFQDSHARFNVRARASILVLMRFVDPPVNDASKIRASGISGDWGRLLPIGQFLRRRLSSGSCSTVSDQWSMRWIVLYTSTKCDRLVSFGTESRFLLIR
jgi:hypothetical protein